jgi:NAD(P)H-nitrite reductase large subunit
VNYCIIGNGAAAVNAIEGIRERDKSGSITVLSEESYEAYGRPLISYWLEGKVTEDKMVYRPRGFYAKYGVDLKLGVAATAIDTAEKVVTLSDGTTVAYDKLLMATGGRPIVPPMDGLNEVGYLNFIKFDDAKALDAMVAPGKAAMVIGGGFIGLKAAEALVRRGVRVELVEKADWVLSTMLDRDAAHIVQSELLKAGVVIHTGVVGSKATRTADGRIDVTLSDGTEMTVDVIVVAVGVLPQTTVAGPAGLKLNRGILVDSFMQTGTPDVYAAGDVAEALDVLSGANRVAAIMPNAATQGRVAGRNMAGAGVSYDGSVAFNSVGVFGVSTISMGNAAFDLEGCEIHVAADDATYRKIVIREGKVRGAVFINDLERAGIVQGLIRLGTDVSPFKHALVAGDLALINWPAELRAQRLAK